jgi:hypothetical protein
LAKEGKEKGVLALNDHPETILHAIHDDDCADAYVALVQDELRETVGGECFNISSHRFETFEEIAQALVKEYEIEGSVKWGPIPEGNVDVLFERGTLCFFSSLAMNNNTAMKNCCCFEMVLTNWLLQLTGSDKLRILIGFKYQRQLFAKRFTQY